MGTSRVSRLIQAPCETVYRACSEPAELARWRMPRDMSARLLGVDGASYRMALGYPDGRADTFEASFAERVPNEKVVERVRFDAPERAGAMTVTTTLRSLNGGTEVIVLTENLPRRSGPRTTTRAPGRRWPGWRSLSWDAPTSTGKACRRFFRSAVAA